MLMKPPKILLLLLFPAILDPSLGCSCSDRTADETEREDQMRLCTRKCEADVACVMARGDEYTQEECMGRCAANYFNEHNVGCEVVAKRALECFIAESTPCANDAACEDEKYPFSVCIADPARWAANDCDDKCPGECCVNMGE
jgi:hypothetical protein